ncbi:MAG TPA: bifunctional diaminohydroxyphosphoribosylaminopyrimidine deaminase/5-amino-6-(5-phosphoribosylamino)uracil reductase RibD [Bacteroidia bacterium]|nr:bifunctional diaminohydroxyphosphoribosylaminopyrimidine deaminase/5-amino-6-(5-phosphoribosylamino)uracil reductase RibD [Bacteroidia bacterium]
MSLQAEQLMRKALELATLGWPRVAPNPMVGALVVHQGKIVSQGYHKQYGEAHAEVMAITYIPADIDPRECELFVSLEPCSHQGKTPPCADLIISRGIKKVWIAAGDPNPLVAGRGIEKLRRAGVEIEFGLLEKESRNLNRRFYTFHEKKRPFIQLKWAQSADGYISRLPAPQNRENNLISGPEAQRFAHKLRAENMAVLVGKQTVLTDNPALNTRLVSGKSPLRVFIDRNLEVPGHYKVYDKQVKTLVFNEKNESLNKRLTYIRLDFGQNILPQMLDRLHRLGVQSLLVEGGTFTINAFLKAGLYDEVLMIRNPDLMLHKGLKAPDFDFTGLEPKYLGKDQLYKYSHLA